jgi:transposase-like protein
MKCPKCNSDKIFKHNATVQYNLSSTKFPRSTIPRYKCLSCNCNFDIKIERR